MSDTTVYVMYGLMVVGSLVASWFVLRNIISYEKELHQKRNSESAKERLEYKEIKKKQKYDNTWFLVTLILVVFFYFILGVWGVLAAIVVRLLADAITRGILGKEQK